jgi:adenosylhomocysteine nucleosidase
MKGNTASAAACSNLHGSIGEQRRLGIVAAADEELAALEHRVEAKTVTSVGACRLVRGRIGITPIVLARTGEGRRSAEAGIRTLIEHEGVERVAIIGFSGGLSPGLRPGTLLVATQIVEHGAPAPGPDRDWSERLEQQVGVRAATIVTVDRILCTPQSKMETWTGLSQDRPAAADLETAAMAAVAAARGVPFVVIRAISDPAEEALPIDFNDCLDPSGRISRARVVARAALHPSLIAPLWRLRGRARTCSRRLADVVCRSIEGELS